MHKFRISSAYDLKDNRYHVKIDAIGGDHEPHFTWTDTVKTHNWPSTLQIELFEKLSNGINILMETIAANKEENDV